MGLGVLEDRVLEHVPGTNRYFDDPSHPVLGPDGAPHGAAELKCDNSGPVPIVLVPQPSDDPNDPLNWPLWKRDLITVILSSTAIFATALGPILAANTITLSLWFTENLTQVALLTGYFLLGCGAGSIFFVPSSRIWGKRHAFIIGLLILIGSSAWSGAVGTNYKSMIGSRVVQGIGVAPYEALLNVVVGDMYFVHERGKRMAFTNLAAFGGAFFTPILVGKITHTLQWWWTFYLVAIFCAACLPLVFFFCPETAFRRDQSLNTDMLATSPRRSAEVVAVTDGAGSDEQQQPSSSLDEPSKEAPPANGTETTASATPPPGDDEEKQRQARPSVTNGVTAPIPQKKTFRQSIALFDGRKTDDSFWKLLLRPIVLFAQPAFLWGCFIQGAMIGWTVFIGVILGSIYLGPPMWWDEVYTGYAYTGAFIGALVGFIVAGALADWSVKVMTRYNGGIYEPEFRILMTIPQMILGLIGLYGFGITSDGMQKGTSHWSIPLMFFGFEVAGMVVGAVASSLYIVDAYRDLAIEGFTCMIIFKNFFSYGLTYKAYDWILENQTKATPVFNALGSVQLVVCLTSIPMYIYGKRIRSFFFRHDILKATGLR